MGRIGIALLIAATAARAEDLSSAMKLLKLGDANNLVRGAEIVQRLGPKAKKAAPLLVKHLNHEVWHVRDVTRLALIAIGSGACPAMTKALKKSKSLRHRRSIAKTMAEIRPRESKYAGALIKALDEPDSTTRHHLAKALSRQGRQAIPMLVRALTSRSPDQRAGAAMALGYIGIEAHPALTEALASKQALQRAGAAEAFGHMGDQAPAVNGKLRVLLKDPESSVRGAAATALGRIGAKQAETVAALVATFADPEPNVREAAILGATRFGDDGAMVLVDALSGAQTREAERALVLMGKGAYEALTAGLASSQASVREGSARAFGDMGPLISVPLKQIAELLKDKDIAVRRATAVTLGKRYPSGWWRRLVKATQDVDPTVRAVAVRALAKAQASKEVLAALEAATKDPDAEVQLAAAAARWNFGQETDVVARARKLLAEPAERLHLAACTALRPMGRAAEPALPDLIAASQSRPSVALCDALGAITAAHGNGLLGRAKRYERAPAATRKSIDAALNWLARFQDTHASGKYKGDGRWDAVQFTKQDPHGRVDGPGQPLYTGGVTGMALSAFLAVGRIDNNNVREAIQYLVRTQRSDGVLADSKSQHYLIAHAFATAAVCEAWIVTGDPNSRRAAQSAVDYLMAARNPDLGWRYEPRGGENDTNVTVAAVNALELAVRGGLNVDPAAFAGAGRWITRMTDVQIGYNVPGGSSARPEGLQENFPPENSGSMTAAGIWGLALAERHGVNPPALKTALEICRKLPPRWDAGHIDMYYWHYGTLTFYVQGGKDWKKWNGKLNEALVESQRDDELFTGSWNPIGPWGHDGGRIYSTALNALSLATPYRFTPDFTQAKPTGAYAEAAKALVELTKGGAPLIRARAKLWLRRAGAARR